MTERLAKPLPFFVAVKEIAIFYAHVFKHIIGLVFLAALVQAAVSLLIPQNPTVGLAVSILSSVVTMFFYAWILAHADAILNHRDESKEAAFALAKKRFLPLIGVLAVYIALGIVLFLFGFGMQMLGKITHLMWLFAAITLAVALFVLVLLAFSMPAVILDGMPVFKSFESSIKLVWGHWWRVFGIIIIFIVPVLLLSLAVLLFNTSNILVLTVYEFFYHLITYPLMISLILILYYDLKARHHMEGFRQISNYQKNP